MGRVIIDEIAGQAADVFDAGEAALQFQAAFDQLAGAGADHVARGMQGHRGQALAVENEVERVDQVGRRIDERAVKIEHNGAGRGHRKSLSVRGAIMQVGTTGICHGQRSARQPKVAGSGR